MSLWNLKLTWLPFTLCLLSWCFHVEICIYWRIFMLRRSHFILLISFTELSCLSHQTGQFYLTQNRVGHLVTLLECWLPGINCLILSKKLFHRLRWRISFYTGMPNMVKDFPGIPPVGSLDMTTYDQRNQPYVIHIHVHIFHVRLTYFWVKVTIYITLYYV